MIVARSCGPFRFQPSDSDARAVLAEIFSFFNRGGEEGIVLLFGQPGISVILIHFTYSVANRRA